MSKNFDEFLSQLSETNATLGFFTDFPKVVDNVSNIEIKLNQLNYLIGKENLEEACQELYRENPSCFSVLGILIAVREDHKKKVINDKYEVVPIESYFNSVNGVIQFINETGLADVFKNKNIKNLVDYVFGIEVGLDTNARKNRSGDNMSKAIQKQFDKAEIIYDMEVNSTVFPELANLGTDVKRFDFVIRTKEKTYLIETNYYNGGGSKLNEVARAYTDVAAKINQHKNFEFVWITDGQGWYSAKNKLEEAYYSIESVYNLRTLKVFINQINKDGK